MTEPATFGGGGSPDGPNFDQGGSGGAGNFGGGGGGGSYNSTISSPVPQAGSGGTQLGYVSHHVLVLNVAQGRLRTFARDRHVELDLGRFHANRAAAAPVRVSDLLDV